jgi:hypothetical protein
MATQPDMHPIRLVVTDDLKRSRVTVLFRIVLVIPLVLWAGIWGGAVWGGSDWNWDDTGKAGAGAAGTVVVAWLVTLFSAHLWDELHAFHARFLRWVTHLTAYFALLADPYPRFDARPGYPVDVEVDAPQRQNRWKTGFRIILAIPALIFSIVLGVLLIALAIGSWFVSLALGRLPREMRDLGAYCVRFIAQTDAYLLFLTDRYPTLSSTTGGASGDTGDTG